MFVFIQKVFIIDLIRINYGTCDNHALTTCISEISKHTGKRHDKNITNMWTPLLGDFFKQIQTSILVILHF